MSLNPKALFDAISMRAEPEEKVSVVENAMMITNRVCFYREPFKGITFDSFNYEDLEDAFNSLLTYIPDEWGGDEDDFEWDSHVVEVNRKARLAQVVHELKSVKKRRAFF
ncbi:hypothetical protein [Aneurinibacillus tyrosinisolvens]|uniref:hypothetical protein n=1 Tax=Aneurinibacillus tyrosinisolvens TaxID=1443435 RepID=UPI00063F6A43|nr:hypothetical protein [Aneurinibacillus tyrosinisolvens]